ncbi:hypothetical protein ILUMI_21838 [Ignelater luminosus]|uniref:G-protein coupled receptors family 1 profile domain-containing protein n=1 Tax=Ignelater luminosus TaxID=2038154 RepID=A0A8K0CBN8_IGNLU|nr:hypothetical protein ILUMI_21838 [Ignelater luminosus]
MEDNSWNSSYVFGIDNESGWGERYFFTYFSEFGERILTAVVAEVTILTTIFLVSVFANVAIAVCVFRFPDMRTVTNCFVLNLAAADLLFALSIPAVAYTRVVPSWKLGDIACRFIPYTQFVSGIVLLWTLCLISMDRYRCIVVPPYRSKIKPKQASICAASTWILTSVVFIPVTFWFRQVEVENNKTVCTLVFPKSEKINYSFCFVIPLVLIACLLPMVMLVYHYQRIFQKILSTRSTWAASCVVVSTTDMKGATNRDQMRRQSELSITDILAPWPRKFSTNSQFSGSPNGGRHGSLSHHEELRLNKHIRVVRVLFLNVLVVLLMWLPITTMMFLIFLDGRRANEDTNFFMRSHYFIISLIIAFLNTVVNPLLYGVLSDNFRSCLLRMWCLQQNEDCKLTKENVTPTSGRNLGGSSKNSRKQSYVNSISESPNDIV